ncbi:hypothetical protein SAY87_031570 [Trapa incisa]|uniref:Uncharacterized protein n=1 Tax=Trapa incisa TaxID=236973 RepID=A0AAN7KVA0_9MYRT|nr:hypothetical protein SAY87_031570 [Trapa incisa]
MTRVFRDGNPRFTMEVALKKGMNQQGVQRHEMEVIKEGLLEGNVKIRWANENNLYPSSRYPNWRLFEEIFKKRYLPSHMVQEIRKALYSLGQGERIVLGRS